MSEDRSHFEQARDAASTPADLKVKIREQTLHVQWQDGAASEFTLGELRRACPCATCRTQRQEQDQNPLKILKFDPTDIRVVSASLVGTYAIQFRWSDGHDTGIYDFRYLRSLADKPS